MNGVAFASFIASGQTCVAGTRIIVQRAIFPQFVAALKQKAESIERRMGSPFNEASMMGPVISSRQLGVVEELVEAAREDGAEIVCGGTRMQGKSALDGLNLSNGFFYPPTLIIDGPSTKITDTRIWREEAFGPVLAIVAFDTEEEAIALANDSEYGLGKISELPLLHSRSALTYYFYSGSAIWTRDGAQAIRVANQVRFLLGLFWYGGSLIFLVRVLARCRLGVG